MAFFAEATTTDRLVLTGRIVTMDRAGTVHPKGILCIEQDRIAAVVGDLAHVPAEFAGIAPIDTHGTIYPGLIELHNHLSYNFLPLWSVPRRYTNRNQWRTTEPDYDVCIAMPAKIIGSNIDIDYPRSIARFVECRSLLGGATTSQGLSSSGAGGSKWYRGLIRNVEAPNDAIFPAAGGQTLDYAPEEIATKLVPALARDRPFFYHLSEGTDADARQRFLDLQYAPGTWAIDDDLITIHCTALQPGDLPQLANGAGIVWSPLSNLLLYGSTADVAAAKQAGLRIALGSDWSPSGSKNLLGELKIARIVSDHLGGLFTNADLARMVTSTPAEMLGWSGQVGSIERGKKADLLILEGDAPDPHAQLIDAREDDVLAVVIDGRPRHGRMGFLDFHASRQERIVIGGKDYSLDLTEAGTDMLAGLSLATAIAKLTHGLANLPALAAQAAAVPAHALAYFDRQPVSVDFELEDPVDFSAFQTMALRAVPALKPLALAPITAVDDAGFVPALKANRNLPAYLVNAL
ncbi:amidohydrolase family protein [Sphingomonas sp. BIUV-7]|uniref:Amidohydrolase family protein n=1 Tax=Sphingomonas natans TaxID=3063330 RepID=A0ABT8YBW5_9SPHN|nr:amidohydrolase family protein [Sphingomonas sp. BIUV-7]MDO6415836.1 amidohydrolase family protein [Sphingomonas sp. BIUV-7]